MIKKYIEAVDLFEINKNQRQNYLCQMSAWYPGTFFYSVTLKPSDNSYHISTKALSRRTSAINKANHPTLPGILSMLECTDFQTKVSTMLVTQ